MVVFSFLGLILYAASQHSVKKHAAFFLGVQRYWKDTFAN